MRVNYNAVNYVECILLNSIRQAEEKHTRQAVAGVSSSFIQTQDDFNYRFADWSEWDDT